MISQLPPELVTQIIEISIPTCRPCDNLDYINQITTRYSYLKNYSLVNTIWQDIATEKLVEMIWLRRSYTSAKELGRLLNRNEGYMASKVKNLWIGSGASMVDLPIMNRLEELWYQIHGIPSLEWLSQGRYTICGGVVSNRIFGSTTDFLLLSLSRYSNKSSIFESTK